MELFLTLLRIIGILILAVILLVLLVVLLVLLCPVRYRIQIFRELNQSPQGKVRVTWLLHLISLRIEYQEKLSYCLKVLGFTVMKADYVLGGKDEASETSGKALENAYNKWELKENRETEDENEVLWFNREEPSGGENSEEKNSTDPQGSASHQEDTDSQENAAAATAEEKEPLPHRIAEWINRAAEFLAGLQEKIPEKIAEVLEKVAEFLEKAAEWPDMLLEKAETLQRKKDKLQKQLEDEQHRVAVRSIFGTVGQLVSHIRPRKLTVKGRLGFDDPAATGQIFGVMGMLMPIYGDNIHLEAVFDEAVVEGWLEARGRIRLGTLVVMAVRLISKREVRRLITHLKRMKKA